MITIIVPCIRPEGLKRFINNVDASVLEEWNLIVVGPEYIEVEKTELMQSYVSIIDKGSPSRCLQRAVSIVSDDIFTWGTDDAVYVPGELKRCIDLLRNNKGSDGIIVKYVEGGDCPFNGSLDSYYVAGNHGDNIQPGIDPKWTTAPVGMFYTEYFKDMGGLDCRFEHINMNIHDFCYRLQRDGGILHFSPEVVMICDSNNAEAIHRPLDVAHQQNDMPLFRYIYRDKSRELKIEFDNWKDSPEVWRRFE